jgi:hypothetical protein
VGIQRRIEEPQRQSIHTSIKYVISFELFEIEKIARDDPVA